MAKCVVPWTSHKQAIIISIKDGVEKILHVESKAKRRVEEKCLQHQSEYYRRVVQAIQDARDIFIFGPAQARVELQSGILKSESLSHRVVGTETADTMTENQLVPRTIEICGSRPVQKG